MSKASKAVVITGASGGIGQAICQEFSGRGWDVIPLDLRMSPSNFSNLPAFDLVRFVRDHGYRDDGIAKIRALLPSKMQRLVLVNNAAVQKLAPATNLTVADWDETLTVNLLAPFFMSQSLFCELSSNAGSIINIGSIHGMLTKPDFTAYATSKGALTNLTRSLAVEWAPHGVSVNAICPAAIDTPMLREGFLGRSDALKDLASYHPTKKIGNPRDVAKVVFMLADCEIRFLTGSVLDLSGGINSLLHDPT